MKNVFNIICFYTVMTIIIVCLTSNTLGWHTAVGVGMLLVVMNMLCNRSINIYEVSGVNWLRAHFDNKVINDMVNE